MSEKLKRTLRPVLITILSVLLNYGGRSLCLRFSLPFWFDTQGTFITGYALGPVSAAIVGFTTNALFSASNPITLVYGVINGLIGAAIGIAARRGAFRTFFSSASFAAFLALGTSILFTIPNMIFHAGGTDNIWGDAVASSFRNIGLLPGLASFLGEGYIEFADKMIMALLFRLLLALYRRIRFSRAKVRTGGGTDGRNSGGTDGRNSGGIDGRNSGGTDGRNSGGTDGRNSGGTDGRNSGGTDRRQAERTDVKEDSDQNGFGPGTSERKEHGVRMAAFLLLLPAAVFISANSVHAAQEENVRFESYRRTVYDAMNGLVSGHATDVTSASDGSLWIGSYAGLYRYDGQTFEPQDVSGIRSVNCVYTDDNGRIWVGSNDSGLVVLIDGEVSASADSKSGLCSDSIRDITEVSDGTFYVGTSDYVQHIRLSDGIEVIEDLTEVPFAKCIDADDEGNAAAVSEDGTLFLIRDGQVTDRIPKEEHSENLSEDGADKTDGADETDGAEETGFSAAAFDDDGHLFAGTEDGVILEYDVADGEMTRLGSRTLDVQTVVNDLEVVKNAENQVESVLVLTDQGLFRTPEEGTEQLDTGEFTHSLQHLTVDYQGNIWIASTRDGLLKLSDSPFRDLFGECGVSPGLVNACFRWQGLLYAGCDDGLVILDEERMEEKEDALTGMLEGVRVRYFAADDENRLYIATYGRGVIVEDVSGTITELPGDENGPGSRVRTLLALADGTVLASGENGISYLKDGKAEKLIPYGGGLGSAAALCFAETSDGVLAGTDGNGLFLIRDGEIGQHFTKEDGLLSDVILKIVPCGTGKWILVTSNSLCLLADGKIRVLESFPYSNNYDVLPGENGRVYVTGSAGLYVTTADNLEHDRAEGAFLIGPSNGLDYSFTVNSQNMASDGAIRLCTGDGVIGVTADRVMSSEESIRMRVLSIETPDESIRAEDGVTPVLPGDTGTVRIASEVINYSDYLPELEYRLAGYEDIWHVTEPDELGGIAYANLPPGDYTFELGLVDRDTDEMTEKTSFSFRVEEKLEDTRLFKVYLIGMAIVFAVWAAWYTTRQVLMSRAKRAQREVEEARARVAMGNKAIISIARALYAKDELTGQHSYNVAYYSAKLGKAYGFSKNECQNLRKAALLHDIGKIAIPDAVLNKPGRLTNEEYAVMKTHTSIGAEILSGFTLIDHVSEGAKYHHERYDGRGYPDGIAGENIPLYGRIIAVADAYDAMTAKRVYRDKQDVSFAVEEIRKGRGTQFDPALADLFLKLIEDGEVDPEKVRELYEKRDPEEDLLADEDI